MKKRLRALAFPLVLSLLFLLEDDITFFLK